MWFGLLRFRSEGLSASERAQSACRRARGEVTDQLPGTAFLRAGVSGAVAPTSHP